MISVPEHLVQRRQWRRRPAHHVIFDSVWSICFAAHTYIYNWISAQLLLLLLSFISDSKENIASLDLFKLICFLDSASIYFCWLLFPVSFYGIFVYMVRVQYHIKWQKRAITVKYNRCPTLSVRHISILLWMCAITKFISGFNIRWSLLFYMHAKWLYSIMSHKRENMCLARIRCIWKDVADRFDVSNTLVCVRVRLASGESLWRANEIVTCTQTLTQFNGIERITEINYETYKKVVDSHVNVTVSGNDFCY